MGKDNEKSLVGQPIFNQILKKIPRELFDRIVLGQKSDHRFRTFSSWDELVTLLFGIFERCDSAREVCDGMAALGGKLNYLGMDSAPAKSTFNDALIHRNALVFEQFYLYYVRSTSILRCSIIFRKFYRTAEKKGLVLRSFTCTTYEVRVCL